MGQYGNRKENSDMAALVSEAGSSYISDVDSHISWKCDIEIDFRLLKQVLLIEIA